MTKKNRYAFGSKRRDSIWYAGVYQAMAAGRGHRTTGPGGWTPICPHCDEPVLPTDEWDRCHVAVPAAFGGRRMLPGHRPCNQLDNNQVVTPAAARAKRREAIATGKKGPGLGRYPMRAGRLSHLTKTMRHGVQPRRTYAQKHALTMRRRSILTQQEA